MAKGNKPMTSFMTPGREKPPIRFGRPPVFSSVDELNALLEEYFTTKDPASWTLTGVRLYVGMSKTAWYEYMDKPEFTDSLSMATDLVADSYEAVLKEKGHSGSIFAMKNFGWKDKQEQEVTHHGLTLNLQKFTPNSDNNDNETRATE